MRSPFAIFTVYANFYMKYCVYSQKLLRIFAIIIAYIRKSIAYIRNNYCVYSQKLLRIFAIIITYIRKSIAYIRNIYCVYSQNLLRIYAKVLRIYAIINFFTYFIWHQWASVSFLFYSSIISFHFRIDYRMHTLLVKL